MTSPEWRFTMSGIQALQTANNKAIAALKPDSAFGRAVKNVTVEAHRRAVAFTHVQSGALRASQRMEVSGLRGRVYIDPASSGRGAARPAEYGVTEHARGGEHAFYERALDDADDYVNAALAGFGIEAGLDG